MKSLPLKHKENGSDDKPTMLEKGIYQCLRIFPCFQLRIAVYRSKLIISHVYCCRCYCCCLFIVHVLFVSHTVFIKPNKIETIQTEFILIIIYMPWSTQLVHECVHWNVPESTISRWLAEKDLACAGPFLTLNHTNGKTSRYWSRLYNIIFTYNKQKKNCMLTRGEEKRKKKNLIISIFPPALSKFWKAHKFCNLSQFDKLQIFQE